MSKSKVKNQRLAIENNIKLWIKVREEGRLYDSWLKTVREALGISTRQLAKRCDIAPSSIVNIEKNEAQYKASLKSINKLANAMDCELVYAIVPKKGYKSYEKIIDSRVKALIDYYIIKADHTMSLEGQKDYPKTSKRKYKDLALELKNKMDSRIWDMNFKNIDE